MRALDSEDSARLVRAEERLGSTPTVVCLGCAERGPWTREGHTKCRLGPTCSALAAASTQPGQGAGSAHGGGVDRGLFPSGMTGQVERRGSLEREVQPRLLKIHPTPTPACQLGSWGDRPHCGHRQRKAATLACLGRAHVYPGSE